MVYSTFILLGIFSLSSIGFAAFSENLDKSFKIENLSENELELDSHPVPQNTEFVGKYGAKNYFTDYTTTMNYTDATEYCHILNMKPVAIASVTELNFLAANIRATSYFWTCGRDKGDSTQMSWANTGAPIAVGLTTLPPVTYGIVLYNDNQGGQLRTYGIGNGYYPLCEQV